MSEETKLLMMLLNEMTTAREGIWACRATLEQTHKTLRTIYMVSVIMAVTLFAILWRV